MHTPAALLYLTRSALCRVWLWQEPVAVVDVPDLLAAARDDDTEPIPADSVAARKYVAAGLRRAYLWMRWLTRACIVSVSSGSRGWARMALQVSISRPYLVIYIYVINLDCMVCLAGARLPRRLTYFLPAVQQILFLGPTNFSTFKLVSDRLLVSPVIQTFVLSKVRPYGD